MRLFATKWVPMKLKDNFIGQHFSLGWSVGRRDLREG